MPTTLTPLAAALQRQLAGRLAQRQAELRAVLASDAGAAVAATDNPPELLDLKDVAAQDSRALLDQAALARARAELRQVAAALQRVARQSYGSCEDCGEPIDPRRLQALPATPFCTACQAIHERPARR